MIIWDSAPHFGIPITPANIKGSGESTCVDPEGRTWGQKHPPPLKNHKNIGCLSNIGLDPLKNHKATKPAFTFWSLLAFAGGPMIAPFIVVFGSPLPLLIKNKKKTLSKLGPL